MAGEQHTCETLGCDAMIGADDPHRYCENHRARTMENKRREVTGDALDLPEIQPIPKQPPIVRHGDVVPMVLNELTTLFRSLVALQQFEARVVEAAKSPAAWLQLRQELAK